MSRLTTEINKNKSKEFSERMHHEAEIYMMNDHEDNPDFPDHFTYIKYNKEKIKEKLDYIFQRLFKEKYLDWLDAGQPVTSDSHYWWAQTKLHLITYLIQREPYHLTDGIWLRGISQGPMSLIDSKLFSIYIDELGNGDENQNHPNVYLNVLKDLSLDIPSIYSREFVDQKQIMNISFQKPLLTLTTSLFPKRFYPEILGYTLWLETTSAAEHAGLRKILERYNLNPKFSLLHTAIDNNLNGHGKYARDIVEKYLEDIFENEGLDSVEKHWKRIWIGYVAYGTTGDISKDLRKLFDQSKILSPRDEFIELIEKKSSFAKQMHGNRRMGSNNCLLNDLFANNQPEKLCFELENSPFIVKGNPRESKFLNHVVSFNGPITSSSSSSSVSVSSSPSSSSTASSVEIYTVMGLFNSGKSEKVEKVEKFEEHHELESPKNRPSRSSKHHRPNKYGAIIRPMPQPLPINGNIFQGSIAYPGNMFSNMSQYKYGYPSNIPYDLSKFTPPTYSYNQYPIAQTTPINFPAIWSNGIYQFNDRSPFQQQPQQQQQQQAFNNFQQTPWPYMQPSNYGFMPPMNF
ncbi:hypothetical protein I4U23_017269 [Adineta vaga]|nr:hypothetical protein I4U23_017269 [Adineta vaga]